jgi:hypothetical protein
MELTNPRSQELPAPTAGRDEFTINKQALAEFFREIKSYYGHLVNVCDFDPLRVPSAGLAEFVFRARCAGVLEAPCGFESSGIKLWSLRDDDEEALLCLQAPYSDRMVTGEWIDATAFEPEEATTEAAAFALRDAIDGVVDEVNFLVAPARLLAGDPAEWARNYDHDGHYDEDYDEDYDDED